MFWAAKWGQAMRPVWGLILAVFWAGEPVSGAAAGDDASCRESALQQQADSIAIFDSSAAKEKQSCSLWKGKFDTMFDASRKVGGSTGRFGDPRVFDAIRRSPAQVAGDMVADLDAALEAVTASVRELDSQMQATPNDPTLYCEDVYAVAHKNILARMAYESTLHKRVLDTMEGYFRLRIKVASAISKAEYEKEKAEIADALLDTYEHEIETSRDNQVVIAQLLRQ